MDELFALYSLERGQAEPAPAMQALPLPEQPCATVIDLTLFELPGPERKSRR
jgi:hypothetical protein